MSERNARAMIGLGLPRSERDALRRELEAEAARIEDEGPPKPDPFKAPVPEPEAPRRKTRRRIPESVKAARAGWIHTDSSDISELLEEAVEHKETLLNAWEKEFLESVEHQVEMNSGLTSKQYGALRDIVERCHDRYKRI